MENTKFIFDKVFKRILTLSSKSVINLINGLFGTTYPEDSTITYNWTEHVDKDLKRTLADTIITINHMNSYHMEAQIDKDNDIVFRVFSYSYHYAEKNRISYSGNYYLNFPEPKIIYLHSDTLIPEKYILHIHFGDRKVFDYEVPTINLKDISAQEFTERRLAALLPFQLLRLRKLFTKSKENITEKELKQLHGLLFNDILLSIQINDKYGFITTNDAKELVGLTHILLNELYGAYPETVEVRSMFDQSLHMEIDDLIIRNEELMDRFRELEQGIQEKEEWISKHKERLVQLDVQLAEQSEMLMRRDEQVAEQSEMLMRQDEKLAEQTEKLTLQDEKLAEQTEKLTLQDEKLAEQTEKLTLQDEKLAEQTEKLTLQDAQLIEKDAEIAYLRAELAKRN